MLHLCIQKGSDMYFVFFNAAFLIFVVFAAYDVEVESPSVVHRLISFLFSADCKTYVTLAGLLTFPVFNSFPLQSPMCIGME